MTAKLTTEGPQWVDAVEKRFCGPLQARLIQGIDLQDSIVAHFYSTASPR
jgi:hypothetical protein